MRPTITEETLDGVDENRRVVPVGTKTEFPCPRCGTLLVTEESDFWLECPNDKCALVEVSHEYVIARQRGLLLDESLRKEKQ